MVSNMNRTETSTGQHRHHHLGDIRHIEKHFIAALDTEVCQTINQAINFMAQGLIGDSALTMIRTTPD